LDNLLSTQLYAVSYIMSPVSI